MIDRIVHWWRHLAWFDVRRARDWQTVILGLIMCGLLLIALAVASLL